MNAGTDATTGAGVDTYANIDVDIDVGADIGKGTYMHTYNMYVHVPMCIYTATRTCLNLYLRIYTCICTYT